jgi:hypothetical protein
MKKQDLVLLIVKAAILGCKNHVLRMHILNQLADRDKQPMRFQGANNSYWLFSIGKVDLIYEVDQDNNWHVKLI